MFGNDLCVLEMADDEIHKIEGAAEEVSEPVY